MTVIGIDPSLTETGIAVLEHGMVHYGRPIRTLPEDPLPVRLDHLRAGVMELIQHERPELVAMESEVFGLQHQAREQGQVQGVLQLAIWDALCSVYHGTLGVHRRFLSINASHVKKWLGAKQKDEILLQVYKRYGVEFSDHNQADAFTIAVIGTSLLGPPDGYTVPQREVLDKLRASGFVWEPRSKPKRKSRARA